MKWWQISITLCIYGFFKEFRPSEPFITPYLIKFKNFTIKEINEEIFPVGTYCYLSLLIFIFLLTDFLRYKPVLLAGSVSAVVTWCLLIWGTTLLEMQVVEFFYGFFMASEVAYYTYIYAKVDKEHYQKVTSHTRAAILLGKAASGVFAQLLIYIKLNYLDLHYFSVFGVGVTVFVALFLPSVPQSLYFHRREIANKTTHHRIRFVSSNETDFKENPNKPQKIVFTRQCRSACTRLYDDFRTAFANFYVLQWSIWWALATCGYLQAISYCQLLWEDILLTDNATQYNGYVEFIYAVSSAAVAFGVGYLKVRWYVWGDIFLGILTISQGGFLFYSAYLDNLYLAYVIFILYRNFYEAAITIATYEVAKFISDDSCALVFGINTFAALLMQTVLTAVVLGSLGINIRHQYQIYGGYHFIVGSAFLVSKILRLLFDKKKKTKNDVSVEAVANEFS